jgi:intein/homing endonuclease
LESVVNVLQNDSETRNKFKIIIAGWDTEGKTTDITFNQDFKVELERLGLWTSEVVRAINKHRGNVDMIPNIPENIREKYRDKVFNQQQRDIRSEESIYLAYEKILTDNHRLIQNEDYLNWLMNFERNVKYENEDNFGRRWTQKANTYAKVLDETDIALAPLADNSFNKMKCVVGDTLVTTNKGVFKIKDIVENKMKLSVGGNDIINWFRYNNEKTIKLITDYGLELEGTETHRIKVDENWKSLNEFKIGDKIKITPYQFENPDYQTIKYPLLLTKGVSDEVKEKSNIELLPEIKITESWGRFFGYLLGDGSFSRGYLRISCDKRHTEVVNDITNLVNGMGLNPIHVEKKPDERCSTSKVKEGYGLDIHIPSKHLADICMNENLKNDTGKVFEVPYFIFKSPKSVISEFLRGLFEADGNVSLESSNITLTTKNHVLAKQIQYLLLGFGILSKVSKSYNKSYKRHYYIVRLNREATDKFWREIGFVSEHKINDLNIIVNKSHSNRFKSEDYYVNISEIITGENDVYDIEVDNSHQYNGNGIINHNSNLKQVECWTRKIPIVCSDIPPYNVHGRHMENCVLIPSKKNAHKYWKKYLKRLILDADLRKKLGEQLYEDFKTEYNLADVTAKRAAFYESVVAKTLELT